MNDTGGNGGAIAAAFGESVFDSFSVVENSLFHDNSTGSLNGTIWSSVTSEEPRLGLVNCTIANNTTGGVYWNADGWPTMVYNSILWNNGAYEVSPNCDDGAMVYYSDIMGGGGCDGFAGNINSNPNFDAPHFSLMAGSQCIDTASVASAPPTDITGAYRDPNPDMGAYEFFPEED